MRTVSINRQVNDGDTYSLRCANLVHSTLMVDASTGYAGSPPTQPVASATFTNVTIAGDSTVTLHGNGSETVKLFVNGTTTNQGTLNVPEGGAGWDSRTGVTFAEIDVNGRFTNVGNVVQSDGPNSFSDLTIKATTPESSFVNDGSIVNPSNLKIDANVLGSGTIEFMPQQRGEYGLLLSHVEIAANRSVDAGQHFDMANGGDLTIGDLTDFHATIDNFTAPYDTGLFPGIPGAGQATAQILLPGIASSNASWDPTSSTLTLNDASGTAIGSLSLSGNYQGASFNATVAQGTDGPTTILTRTA